jgi:predicted transcriptional regulator
MGFVAGRCFPVNMSGTAGDVSLIGVEHMRNGTLSKTDRAILACLIEHSECNVDELAKQLDRTVGYIATRLSLLSRNGHIVPIWPRVVYRVTSAGIEAFGEDGP